MRELVERFDALPVLEKQTEIEALVVKKALKQDAAYPTVAIVMATHNRLSYLLTYIYSVLLQEKVNVNFYISDDGSSDDTPKFMQKLQLSYPKIFDYHYSVEKVGPSTNRKIALSKVFADAVIFSDDDDYYIKADFLSEACSSILAKDANASLFFGSSLILDTVTQKTTPVILNYLGSSTENVLKNLLFSMRKPPSTFLMVFKFEERLKQQLLEMKMMNDVPIYLLILSYYSGFVTGSKEICGVYREHASNITKSLDGNFILDNIMQQIAVVEMSTLSKADRRNLIERHIKNNVEYYLSSGPTIKEDRERLYTLLKEKGYPLSWYRKWKYKRRYGF